MCSRAEAPCRSGFGLAATEAGEAGVGVCSPGPGLTGLACLRVHKTAAATVEAVVRGAVGAAGRAVRRPGSSRSRSRSRSGAGSAGLAGLGCAGRVGSPSVGAGALFHWVWRSWGCVVAGVCMCGVTSFRYCVLPTAICQLPTANCRLRTARLRSVGVPGVSFLRVCRLGVCASFGALPPVGVIPSGRSLASRFRVRPSGFLGLGASPDSTWGIPCKPRAEHPLTRERAWWSRILPAGRVGQRLGLVCLHLLDSCTESISLCVHQLSPTPDSTASPTRRETISCSTPIRLHPNRNRPGSRQRPAPPATSPSLPA